MAAIRSLGSFGAITTQVQNRLLELTEDPFLLVRITAVRLLHQLGDERAVPHLKKLTSGDLDGRLMRLAEEAVQKITKNFE
jgi:HEAT repeat protein